MKRLSPMLTGAALLFWGVMTDRLWAGLGCALAIEGARFVRLRWDFGERAFVHAWRLSVVAFVITAVLVLTERADPRAMTRVFSWLPVVLLPLEFVQVYGTSPQMGLGVFTAMIRQRRAHALKHGLPFKEVQFSFSNLFLGATLFAASLGTKASGNPWYFPILLALAGWAFLSRGRFSWRRTLAAVLLALLPAAGAAIQGQQQLMALYMKLINRGIAGGGQSDRTRQTSMGNLGMLKQSHEILWRLKSAQGPLPHYLRLSSYQSYGRGSWEFAELPNKTNPKPDDFDNDFQALRNVLNPGNTGDPDDSFTICAPSFSPRLVDPALPRFHLIGGLATKGLIPLPGGAASFHNLTLNSELNTMGAVRVDPLEVVVDVEALWSDSFTIEAPPWQRTEDLRRGRFVLPEGSSPDLDVNLEERPTIERIARELDLEHGSLAEKVEKIRRYFLENFTYTLYNETPVRRSKGQTLIEAFLTKTHKGHCEFFATAGTLLLRQAGVKARYASGFAVMERSRKGDQATVRGVHAHAWCRVWDEEKKLWLDEDFTPPSWGAIEGVQPDRFQFLKDWMQVQRESFLVWRSQPGRLELVTACLLTPIAAGLLFIVRRLWRSRTREAVAVIRRRGGTAADTPLHALERPASRVLGPRPPGRPLAAWLSGLSELLETPETLREALSLHQQLRFDPASPAATAQSRLQDLTRRLKKAIVRLPRRRSAS